MTGCKFCIYHKYTTPKPFNMAPHTCLKPLEPLMSFDPIVGEMVRVPQGVVSCHHKNKGNCEDFEPLK